MTLAQFQVFVAVVDAGSFTEAAKALGMTQSSVSQAIASLEAELGVSLLTRGREGVSLTEIGARLINHVREVLNRTERMRQEAAASVGLEIGRLRLGSFSSVFSRLLPGIIGAFRRRHPGITVVLLEGTDREVRDWVLAGVVDVGLVTLPIEGVESIVIAQDDMRAIVPAGHPRATQPAVRPAQLGPEPFILPQGGCGPLIRAIFRAAGITPRVQFDVRDMATLFAMVQEELGVTLVPALALPLAPIGGVRALPLEPPVQRPIGLVVRSRDAASPAVTAFIHQARAWAKAHGYGRESCTQG